VEDLRRLSWVAKAELAKTEGGRGKEGRKGHLAHVVLAVTDGEGRTICLRTFKITAKPKRVMNSADVSSKAARGEGR
jgi:hypothetical protein